MRNRIDRFAALPTVPTPSMDKTADSLRLRPTAELGDLGISRFTARP